MSPPRKKKGHRGRKDNREGSPANGRRRIGRPRNPARPPPPRQPLPIAPRPESGQAEPESPGAVNDNPPEPPDPYQLRGPVTPAIPIPPPSPDMTAFVGVGPPTAVPVQAQHRPRRRRGGNRGIDLSQLAPDEQATEITFLIRTSAGSAEISLEERALISPRWPQSFISARTVATLALRTEELQAQEKQRLITPAGLIEISSAVIPVFRLEQFQDNRPKWSYMKVPVLDGPDLGVGMILGRPFIEYTFGWNWPSSKPPDVLAQHNAGPVLLNRYYGGVMGAMG